MTQKLRVNDLIRLPIPSFVRIQSPFAVHSLTTGSFEQVHIAASFSHCSNVAVNKSSMLLLRVTGEVNGADAVIAMNVSKISLVRVNRVSANSSEWIANFTGVQVFSDSSTPVRMSILPMGSEINQNRSEPSGTQCRSAEKLREDTVRGSTPTCETCDRCAAPRIRPLLGCIYLHDVPRL